MENNIENKNHIRKIYTDKAENLLKICIAISVFSFLTYLFGIFIENSFDFGLIFEIISFVFIIFSLNNANKNNLQASKTNIIIAMIPIGCLIIYDLLNLLINISEVLSEVAKYYLTFDKYFYYIEPYLFDATLVISIVLLYKAHSSLCKADDSIQSNNYVDTFYDKI